MPNPTASTERYSVSLKTLGKLDADKNGAIDLRELKFVSSSYKGFDSAEYFLKSIDVNADGLLSPEDDIDTDGFLTTKDKELRFNSPHRDYPFNGGATRSVHNNSLDLARVAQKEVLNLTSKIVSKVDILSPNLRITEYTTPAPRLPKALDGLRVLLLSDTHFRAADPATWKKLEALAERLKVIKPDMIFLAGDIVEGLRDDYTVGAQTALRKLTLNEAIPAFAVFGSHDHSAAYQKNTLKKSGAHRGYTWISRTGFKLLSNSEVQLNIRGENIRVYGMDDRLGSFARPPTDHSDDTYSVLLVHDPESADVKVSNRYSLILAGHTHSAQMQFGPLDGTMLLSVLSGWKNLNDQVRGVKYLTPRTLSVITPGVGNAFDLGVTWPRVGKDVEKEGVTLLNLRHIDLK